MSQVPSRFLDELPAALMRDESPARPAAAVPATPSWRGADATAVRRPSRDTWDAAARRDSAASAATTTAPASAPDVPAEYRAGARLRHPTFGVGVVQGAERGGHGLKLRIRFADGVKTILPSFVELTPVS